MNMPRISRSLAAVVVLIALAFLRLSAAGKLSTLQSFGVCVMHGHAVRPLPSNVALGLFDPDPLLDVAYHSDGKIQVWHNLGNGLFEFVGERPAAAEIESMEWKKEHMWSETIMDQFSWGVLHVRHVDGRNEVIHRHDIVPSGFDLRSSNQIPMAPPIDFREVWRSESQTQPNRYMALADIDNDGRTEIAYCFFPQFGDSNRFVVYECVGNDSFVVEWDTILVGGFGPLAATDLDRNGYGEWVIISNGPKFLESTGNRHYRLYNSNISWASVGYITKGIQTDINHNGIPEICIQQANPSPPPGGDATFIYIAEFDFKTATSMSFNRQLARYGGYTFNMAVGQIDGAGRHEIIPSGGSFGFHEPVPIDYLWYNGTTWVVRQIHTGLESGTTAEMFVNLDADTTKELFIGGVGPVGRGSCYALKYVSDTTWRVLWADSSLRNTPLSVNAGILGGQFVVAGANTIDRGSLDTLYTDLNVYRPSGIKLGIWRRHTASVQNFHFLDIDNDGITNLVAPIISHLIPDHLAVYEYSGTLDVNEPSGTLPERFELSQNYPNPFNPATTLRIALPENSNVTLVIYDMLGRKIADVENGMKEAGYHSITWNAGGIASGVYIARFTAMTHSEPNSIVKLSRVIKLVLVK